MSPVEEWLTKLAKTDAPGATPLERVVRPAIALMAVLLLTVAVFFGIEQNVGGLAAAATPAIFCLVFVFLPRFSEVAILRPRISRGRAIGDVGRLEEARAEITLGIDEARRNGVGFMLPMMVSWLGGHPRKDWRK